MAECKHRYSWGVSAWKRCEKCGDYGIVDLAAGDWPKEKLYAALREKGYTLGGLVQLLGYSKKSRHVVIRNRWKEVEWAVASVLGIPPWVIWPSRYLNLNPPEHWRKIVAGKLDELVEEDEDAFAEDEAEDDGEGEEEGGVPDPRTGDG